MSSVGDDKFRQAEEAADVAAAAAARREGGVISHDELMAELGLDDDRDSALGP